MFSLSSCPSKAMFYRRDASNTALGRELQPLVVRLRQAAATGGDQQDSGASCDHEQHVTHAKKEVIIAMSLTSSTAVRLVTSTVLDPLTLGA